MRAHALLRTGLAVAFVASTVIGVNAQANQEQAVTPVDGAGTPGRIARFEGAKQVGDSNIVQGDDGRIHIGTPSGGVGTGTLTGRLGRFQGVDGGLIGWEQRTGSPLFLFGVGGFNDNEQGSGVVGTARATTGTAVGVRGRSNSHDGAGVLGTVGIAPADGTSFTPGSGIGVMGRSLVAGGKGVQGVVLATSGGGIGVEGLTHSPDSHGVIGGVLATTGGGEGISGIVNSPDATAAVFRNRAGGGLIVAQSGPDDQFKFSIEGDGDVYAAGAFYAGHAFDLAERIDTVDVLEPGDVVEIDPERAGQFRKVREAFSTRAAGVVSTKPAVTLGNAGNPNADKRPVLALAGRVPVKVTNEAGAIQIGDLLTPSTTPGVAMRCAEKSKCMGAIVGKALSPLGTATGTVEMLVTLQ
jgi:hypothetical protein